jgi:hypothetical protein
MYMTRKTQGWFQRFPPPPAPLEQRQRGPPQSWQGPTLVALPPPPQDVHSQGAKSSTSTREEGEVGVVSICNFNFF